MKKKKQQEQKKKDNLRRPEMWFFFCWLNTVSLFCVLADPQEKKIQETPGKSFQFSLKSFKTASKSE